VGHVMRRSKLENLVTTGKLCGKRTKGREKYLDGLAKCHNVKKNSDLIRSSGNRVGWRSMVAHAYRHGM